MNHLSDFVTHYGYWAVVVGCLLEGETLLVLAGFAAKQGYLNLPLVMALGAAMGAASDMAFFWLGRRHGAAVLARWPHMNRYRQRLDDELERWGSWVVVGCASCTACASPGRCCWARRRCRPRFVLFNLIGAVVWAVLVAGAGCHGSASVAEAMLGHLRHIEQWLAAGLVLAMLLWGGWRLWRRHSRP